VEDLTRFGIALLSVPAAVIVGGIVIGLIARSAYPMPAVRLTALGCGARIFAQALLSRTGHAA